MQMQGRLERVVVETRRYRVVGDLNLPAEGYRSRLSDFLNQGEVHFIPLINVEMEPLDRSGTAERRPFLAVSREHIELVYPLED